MLFHWAVTFLMVAVVGVEFARALDDAVPWSKKQYKSVCRLAPRWLVVLTKQDDTQETVTAEYRNRGMNRDAYVLDDTRIMKMSPITKSKD